jgi:hypothetical protein
MGRRLTEVWEKSVLHDFSYLPLEFGYGSPIVSHHFRGDSIEFVGPKYSVLNSIDEDADWFECALMDTRDQSLYLPAWRLIETRVGPGDWRPPPGALNEALVGSYVRRWAFGLNAHVADVLAGGPLRTAAFQHLW